MCMRMSPYHIADCLAQQAFVNKLPEIMGLPLALDGLTIEK